MQRIYLDHAATTPLLAEAASAMEQWLDATGNPSSTHQEGQNAKRAIDAARESIASALGCLFGEVCFTSGGTEAANLAILGTALAALPTNRRRIVWSATEHHCVLHTQGLLGALGFEVVQVPTDREARIDRTALAELLDDRTLLVVGMHANNELGSIQDVRAIADLAHKVGAFCFVDAVQTFLCLDWTVADLDADLVGISAHKVGGPTGVGALFVKAGTPLRPLVTGGGQEREMRGGTENVVGIVGFGAAVRVGSERSAEWSETKRRARDAFLATLSRRSTTPYAVSADPTGRVLPGHAHLRFPGVSAERAIIALDRAGVACSAGAACSSGSVEPSHVLRACGYTDAEAKEGLRFSFGRSTSVDEAEEAALRMAETLSRLTSTTPPTR